MPDTVIEKALSHACGGAFFVATLGATHIAVADTCVSYDSPTTFVSEGGVPLDEVSGMAPHSSMDGSFFVHNDRGDGPTLYRIDPNGRLIGEHVVADAEHEDWEDLAAGPCPDAGSCLYIGDIGDNERIRPNVTVYIVREPNRNDERITTIERRTGVYPDGPHNAEALLVHPCTGDVSIVTKELGDDAFVFRFPDMADDVVVLERVASVFLPVQAQNGAEITGGAWDATGDRVALRTLDTILEWIPSTPRAHDHWQDAPRFLAAPAEAKGEAVAYGQQGALFTSSEGLPFQIQRFACDGRDTSSPTCEPESTASAGCAQSAATWWLMWALPVAAICRSRRPLLWPTRSSTTHR